jgi:hypothetical protein
MVRIGVTPAAFEAICASLPIGSIAYVPDLDQKGERLIWLEDAMADRLGATRGPCEGYSDVMSQAGRLRRWRDGGRMRPIAWLGLIAVFAVADSALVGI